MTAPAPAVIAELQAYAKSVGLILTSRCTTCGAALWNKTSLQHKQGPHCRAKAKKNGLDAPAKKSVQTVN